MTLNSQRDSDVRAYRMMSIGPNRSSVPPNFFNSKQHIEETPRSNCSLTPTHQNDVIYDTQSNSSSQIFRHGQNLFPKNRKVAPFQQHQSRIIISNLKDLLRLFRVNLNDDHEFEHQGQIYQIDLEENFQVSPRDNLFQPNKGDENEVFNDVSPIFRGNQEDALLHPPAEERKSSEIQRPHSFRSGDTHQLTPSFTEQMFLRQKQFRDLGIQADLLTNVIQHSSDSIHYVQPAHPPQPSKCETPVLDTYYQDIAAQLAKEIEEEERKEREREEQEKKLLEQQTQQADTYYADIAAQLAAEIEEEERREQEKEEQQKKVQEAKDTYYDDIAAQLAAEIEMEERMEREKEQALNQVKQEFEEHKEDILDSRQPSEIKQANTMNAKVRAGAAVESPSNILLQEDILMTKIHRYTTSSEHLPRKTNTARQSQELENEYKKLQEKLRETEKQLKEMNSRINQQENEDDNRLHLAFMFASPLVMRTQGTAKSENFQSMPLLEFKREFKEITTRLKETQMNINIKKVQATVDNLTQILAQNPISLHFSGHGIENTERFLGRDYYLKRHEGNFLVFESEDGEGELVSEKKLSEFMKQANSNLEFVFVASCNSEPVGQIFKNAGAKHVICVKNGQEIADEAVITFSKSFYYSVFSQSKMTICSSFQMAKKLVEQKFGIGEANKFSLLSQQANPSPSKLYSSLAFKHMPQIGTSDSPISETHQCKGFGPLSKGKLIVLDKQGRFKQFPAKVDNFIGRQIEMHKVVRTVCLNRLVNVIGLPGIGKTALSKNVIHYINERDIFKCGIIFLPLKGIMNCEIFFKKLLAGFLRENFELDKDQLKEVNEGSSEFLLKMALQYLREQEDNLLIVFDNVEDLLHHDKKTFRNLIYDLLVNCPLIHILMTSRLTLGALQDIQEKVVVLQELNVNFSIKLFTSRSREITEQEIKELLECQVERSGNSDSLDKKTTNLNDHHLFTLLSGNPHAIILAAPILLKMSLKELYLLLNSKEMHDVLSVDGITDSTVASLRLSLEATIQILEKEDKESIEFFFLIGLLPGGVSEDELLDLWGDNWEQFTEKLFNFSLLQKKELNDELKEKFILPPFMSNYAEAKISDDLKIKFQNEICRHYAAVCKKILDQNGRSYKKSDKRQSELNHQVMKKLLNHESNIWNCIYRMVDGNSVLERGNSSDREEISEDGNQARLQRFSTMFEMQMNQQELKSQSTLFKRAQKNKTEIFVKQVTNSSNSNDQQMDDALKNFQVGSTISEIEKPNLDHPQRLMMSATMRRNSLMAFDQAPPVLTKDALKQLQPQEQQTLERPSKNFGNTLEEIEENDSFVSDDSMHYQQNLENHEDNKKQEEKLLQKEKQLKDIERNSNVHFQRQSNTKNFLQKLQKADQNTGHNPHTWAKAGTQVMEHFPPLNLNKDQQSFKKDDLIHAEKLVLYYTLNLYLLRENENSLNMIEQYGFKINGCPLYEANLRKIQGLCYLNLNENDKALTNFFMALDHFSTIKCLYGQALCNFGIGYIYFVKGGNLKKQIDDETQLKRSVVSFENALTLFTQINHKVGQGQSHRYLSLIYQRYKDKQRCNFHSQCQRKFNKYNTICKDTPFIPRVHGLEVSLLSEIVHEINAKDLYSKKKELKKKQNSNKQNTPQAVISPLEIVSHQNSAPLVDEELLPFETSQPPFKYDTENYDSGEMFFQRNITIESESPRNEFPRPQNYKTKLDYKLDIVEEEQSEMHTSFHYPTFMSAQNENFDLAGSVSRNVIDQFSQGEAQNSGRSSLSGKDLHISERIFTPQKARQETSLFKNINTRKDTYD